MLLVHIIINEYLFIMKAIYLSFIGLLFYFTATVTYAEIITDGTLGLQGALKGPNYAIDAELGQQRGNNLFHSFSQFNLDQYESATFSGPDNIAHIISRVTGGQSSNINGLIRSTIPDANFYLINPSGLIFGSHASLDVQGSVHVSTADTLYFQDGSEFNALHPNQSTLTVAPITTFGFLTASPTALSIDSSQLAIPSGETLSLVGNNLQFNQAQITSPGGRLNLASVAGEGVVSFQDDELEVSAPLGNITALDSQLGTSGEGGGAIYIRAGQLLLNNSQISANTLGEVNTQGIDVQVNELVGIRGSYLSSSTTGTGRGGDVKVKATNRVAFSGENSEGNLSGIFAQSGKPDDNNNAGDAGDIILETEQLYLEEGGQISSTTFGTGQGGNISMTVKESSYLSGDSQDGNFPSGIIADTEGEADNAGNAGHLQLRTRQLHIQDGARILAATLGGGQGGQINIEVEQEVLISGRGKPRTTTSGSTSRRRSSISTTSYNKGNGGDLKLTASELNLKEDAIIDASTQNVGQAGTIHIEIAGDLNVSGSGGISTTSLNGKAGDLILQSQQLILEEGARIIAMTLGNKTGGNIQIQANQVYLTGESTISASSIRGKGDAGQIKLKIGKSLQMQDSTIETETQQADGGDIQIVSPGYLYLVGSQITTSVHGNMGNGGNITLKPEFIVLDNARIQANAFEGDGGNIAITITGFYELAESVIEASSEYGIDGEITIDSPDANVDESLVILQSNFSDVSRLLKSICNLGHFEKPHNAFLIFPLAGSPLSPTDWQPSAFLSRIGKNNLTTRDYPSSEISHNTNKLLRVSCTKQQ
jgi:filamentous hemagglutinin family protein